jgi:hypothetical protein
MKRIIITSLAVLLGWGVSVNFASAQFGTLGQPPVRPRPTVSPYIDLGVGGAMGYYGLIRPQTDATRSIQELQNVVTRLNPDGSLAGQQDLLNPLNVAPGLQTGHSSTFFNYSHYYPQGGLPGAGTSGLGGVGSNIGGYNPGVTGGIGTGAFGAATGQRTFFGPTFGTFPR